MSAEFFEHAAQHCWPACSKAISCPKKPDHFLKHPRPGCDGCDGSDGSDGRNDDDDVSIELDDVSKIIKQGARARVWRGERARAREKERETGRTRERERGGERGGGEERGEKKRKENRHD